MVGSVIMIMSRQVCDVIPSMYCWTRMCMCMGAVWMDELNLEPLETSTRLSIV